MSDDHDRPRWGGLSASPAEPTTRDGRQLHRVGGCVRAKGHEGPCRNGSGAFDPRLKRERGKHRTHEQVEQALKAQASGDRQPNPKFRSSTQAVEQAKRQGVRRAE